MRLQRVVIYIYLSLVLIVLLVYSTKISKVHRFSLYFTICCQYPQAKQEITLFEHIRLDSRLMNIGTTTFIFVK